MIHSFRLPALLLAAAVAAAPAAAQTGPVTVNASHLRALQGRLDGFAAGLSSEERALWTDVLLRAASAPAASPEVRVTPILEIGPGGGCEDQPGMDGAANRVAIIVQGGRTGTPASGIVVQGGRTPSSRGGIVVQGGRTPAGTAQGANGPRPNPTGTVAIGPKQDDPGAPRPRTGAVAIGPKQDDPGAPRPRTGAVAIGPKQDDPAPPPQSLGRRLAALSAQLPAEERGALEWLLTRAAAAPQGRPGTPGGLPPGTAVSLRQALGIDALAIGPKQDDPAPPPSAQRWILRY
jgi:hypothetical protein